MQQLYIITTKTHLKIGISNNPAKRLSMLNTGNAEDLTLHTAFYPKNISARELETNLHRSYAAYKCRGEWFDIECLPEVINILQKMDSEVHYSALLSPCENPDFRYSNGTKKMKLPHTTKLAPRDKLVEAINSDYLENINIYK